MEVKKVVVAAAGQGTRMQELTKDKPKHLIEVNNRPFLSYVLDNIFLAGYKEIVVVGGYLGEMIKKFTEEHVAPVSGDFKVEFVNQYEKFDPKEKYGTAVVLEVAKEKVGGQPFLFVSGDNLFSVNDLKSMNIDDDFCYVAGIEQEHPEKYGVLKEDPLAPEFLKEIIEKPKEFVGNIVNAGLYKFTPEIFEKIANITKSDRGEYELTDAVSFLAKEKKVKIKKIKDYWYDFGSPEDIKKLEGFLNNGDNKRK